jgi:hypothetical protein
MIDTITGSINDYKLKRIHKFEIQPPRINCHGEEITREKQFCNMPHFNIDIKPDNTLYYKTSLPHLIYKTSFFEVKENDYELCIEKIREKLGFAGVLFDSQDILNRPLSRVDFCRNIQVEHAIPDYLCCLSQFRMSKRDKLNWKDETLYFRNKQREFIIYNKIRSINTNKNCLAERHLINGQPENILRFESKFKTGASINREFGRFVIDKAFSSELCKKIMKKEMDNLERDSNEQLELNFEENDMLMERIKSIRSRNTFLFFLAAQQTPIFLLQHQYNYGLMKKFLFRHYKKSQVYEQISLLESLNEFIIPKEQRDLLSEIRYKLAA